MTNPPKRRADFGSVTSTISSTEAAEADFGNVHSSISTTERSSDPANETARTYTVVSGDSLSRIALHIYGKASRWPAIFEANRDQLNDPDRIHPGQVLKLPAKSDTSNF